MTCLWLMDKRVNLLYSITQICWTVSACPTFNCSTLSQCYTFQDVLLRKGKKWKYLSFTSSDPGYRDIMWHNDHNFEAYCYIYYVGNTARRTVNDIFLVICLTIYFLAWFAICNFIFSLNRKKHLYDTFVLGRPYKVHL